MDLGVLGEAEARERVLALWRPGARLHACDGGWLLRFSRPCLLAPPHPGTPLVVVDGVWVPAPLEGRERRQLQASPGTVLRLEEGRLVPAVVGAALDPAAWLDLEDLAAVGSTALGTEGGPVASALTAPPTKAPPPADPTLSRALDRAPTPAAMPTALEERLPLWARWVAWALAGLDRGLARLAPRPPPRSLRPDRPRPQSPPTWVDRLRERIAAALVDLAARGPLSWMAREEAAALRELLAAFDRGDLEEALRRAVPLGEGGGAPGPTRAGRREGPLRASPTRTRGASMLLSGPDLHQTLRTLYERALQRLLEEDRAQEAAYVLADLLDRPARAVEVLEEAGLVSDAAALAEGRGLDPTWVIRLWIEADALDRAVLLARKHGRFGEVLEVLADRAPWAEGPWRRAWARLLEAAGRPERAAEVLLPVEGTRAEVLDLLDRAVLSGGSTEARALGLAVTADLPLSLHRLEDLLEAPGARGREARRTLSQVLVARSPLGPGLPRRLASRLARARLSDAPSGDPAAVARTVERLLVQADDALLLEDRPRRLRPPAGLRRTRWAREDVGDAPVRDLAALEDGTLLVALGEAGVQRLDPDGGLVARWSVPADQLVVPEEGGRALVLARRDDQVRIHRIGPEGTAAWTRLGLHAWARSHDGTRWCGVVGGDVLVLDLLSDAARSLWRVPTGGRIVALHRERARLGAAVRLGAEAELWRWDLPGMVLRARVPLEHAEGLRFLGPELVSDRGALSVVGIHPRELLTATDRRDRRLVDGHVDGRGGLLMLAEGADLALRPTLQGEVEELRLLGARAGVVRAGPDGRRLVGDDRGRVLGLHPDGTVEVDLRVRLDPG